MLSSSIYSIDNEIVHQMSWVLVAILFIATIIISFFYYKSEKKQYYILEKGKISIDYGLSNTDPKSYDLSKYSNSAKQSFAGKIINYGTINLKGNGTEVILEGVPEVYKINKVINSIR